MTCTFIVDDDPDFVRLVESCLQAVGHEVRSTTSSPHALEEIHAFRPDCVLVDLMMPAVNGLQLCQQVKADPQLANTQVIVVTAKSYNSDRRQAMSAGADAFLTKPIQPHDFARQVEAIIANELEVAFWGSRGTLPVPGAQTVRYGGNTSCVSVAAKNNCLFVFDAGTGIRLLSDYLMAKGGYDVGKILISHTHTDHINTLPFFAPLHTSGNEFGIMGGAPPDIPLQQIISRQMQSEYFPITMQEFAARVYFEELAEGTFDIDCARIQTMLLNHPGICLGYRLDYGSTSVCYVTDNELFLEDDPRHNAAYVNQLTQLVKDADILITDCTYTDEEYQSKVGWGHSCVSEVVKLAHHAEVKSLYLHHHDISQTDDDIDRKLDSARQQLETMGSHTNCFAATEGERVRLQSHSLSCVR